MTIDSIAIAKINEDTIIRGVGNELHLHTNTSEERILDYRLQHKIHGIVVDNNRNGQHIIVFGERELMLLEISNVKPQFKLKYEAELSDWISAACFIEDGHEFVCLTAHSVLLRFAISDHIKLLERSSCADKSTLYCAHLHGTQWSNLLIFGGNAFGELIVWQACLNTPNAGKPAKAELLQRVTTHNNGVVFSIDYDETEKLLITTSDDRSIRFWRVELRSNSWQHAKLILLVSGFGHVSRVFCSKLIKCGNKTYALTAGEDSHVCIWSSSGQLIYKCRKQFGAIIWQMLYDEDKQLIYTVGSTGNIVAMNLKEILQEIDQENAKLLSKVADNEFVTKIKFVNAHFLVGVTNLNNLVYLTTIEGMWQVVQDFHKLKCSVFEIRHNLLALCGHKWLTIYEINAQNATFTIIYNNTNLTQLEVIRGFQFLNEHKFLISDGLGNCCYLQISAKQQSTHISELSLPLGKERWLTTALLLPDDNYLLASNRKGNLLLYKRQLGKDFRLETMLKHVHGNLGATVLQVIEDNADKFIIRSAGRNGSLKIIALHKKTNTLSLQRSEIIPISWVENILTLSNGSSLLLGFNDNHFVAWCEEHEFLAKIPCGGGHRFWHFNLTANLQLVFIQNRRVKYYNKQCLFQQFCQQHIKLPTPNTWHVKPCNKALLLDTHTLISAGDDNLIKIFKLKEEANSLVLQREQLKLHAHISNIRALKLLTNAKEHYLISGGGRAQLCVHSLIIDSDDLKAQLLMNHTLKSEATEDVMKKSADYKFDTETRIMAIDALYNNELHLFIGCSDAYVRILHVCRQTYNILRQHELYMGRCVLQTFIIADFNKMLLATTDGFLQFYNMDLESNEPAAPKIQHHDSGVNALHIRVVDGKVLHVISGGDDQCIVYSKLSLLDFSQLCTWKLDAVHMAQVTAAYLSKDAKFVYTAGVDQQVVKIDVDKVEVLETKRTFVADVKGLCYWESKKKCLVYGSGCQIISI